MDTLKIAIQNANELQHRILELKTFLHDNEIDVMLIAETHFTVKNYIKIPSYNFYDTNHPSGRARCDSAVTIKQDIKHHNTHHSIANTHIQAAAMTIHTIHGNITIVAVYCPPKHKISIQ